MDTYVNGAKLLTARIIPSSSYSSYSHPQHRLRMREGGQSKKAYQFVYPAIHAVTVCTYAESRKCGEAKKKADMNEIYVSYVNNNIFLQLS